MEKNECKLKMDDLYFSKCEFAQTRASSTDSNENYNASFCIEYAVSRSDSERFKVTIKTSVTNKSGNIHVDVEAVGIFTVDNSNLDKEVEEAIIHTNTVAIMFPYIRSQISLLTTQPGIKPIVLPPMNINAIVDSTQKASKDNRT